MKKILLLVTFLVFSYSNVLADGDIKCKKFDLICKSKKAMKNSIDYQKKGLKESKQQLKKTTKPITDIPSKIIKKK
jgi:hypothetical protein